MRAAVAKFYPKSRTLQRWHHILTLTDPRIHDYLVAAPILILPLTEGANYGNKNHRTFVCRRAGEICHRGVTIEGFDFVALQTFYDLVMEGEKMRHCVGSYFAEVLSGISRIYSIQKDGEKLATLEYRRNRLDSTVLSFGQLKAKCNARPDKEIRKAADEFSRLGRKQDWFAVKPMEA